MSDTILKLIPTNPSYLPDEFSRRIAYDLLQGLFPEATIEVFTTSEIEFVDPGENFGSVGCNLCKQPIELKQWQEAMDAAYATQFEELTFVTPCCSRPTSLNDLNYSWPCGFAKFQLTARNPHVDLPQSVLQQLQAALATPLRIIWAHY